MVTDKNLVLNLIIIWILLNILHPLILSSFERLYSSQIDIVVKKTVNLFIFLIKKASQYSLIIIFLPTIILVNVLVKIYPSKRKKSKALFYGFKLSFDKLLKHGSKEFIREPFYTFFPVKKRRNRVIKSDMLAYITANKSADYKALLDYLYFLSKRKHSEKKIIDLLQELIVEGKIFIDNQMIYHLR